jgi:putative transposase
MSDRLESPDMDSPGQAWRLKFVAEEMFNGRRKRATPIVDNFSRQSLAIDVDFRSNRELVVGTAKRVLSQSRRPNRIQIDSGSELILRVFHKYAD